MATVRVRRQDYEDGALPRVCARTGAPAQVLIAHRSRRGVGPWGLLLLLLGPAGLIIWFVLDRVLARRDVHGLLPASHDALAASKATRRRFDVVAFVGLIVTAIGVVLAVVGDGSVVSIGIGLGVAGVVVAGLAWFVPASLLPKGVPDLDGVWIELQGVSPALAAAYEEQEGARAAVRRADARVVDLTTPTEETAAPL